MLATRRRRILSEVGLVAALTAIGAALRLYRLTELPPGLHGDEALTGLDAMRILQQGWIGPYTGSALGQPSGPLYWTALFFKLLDPSVFSLRLSMAVLGITTIPALYLFARVAFNRRVAVIAAALLTFSYWHIHFSHTGYMLIALPLVEAASLWLLFLALRSRRTIHFALAGAALGLGCYTYNSFPAFLAAVVAFWGYRLLKERRRFVAEARTCALFFGVALLVAAPFLGYVLEPRHAYFNHLQLVSIFNNSAYKAQPTTEARLAFIGQRAITTASAFVRPGRIDFSDAMGEAPLLDPITGALAAGGILLGLWRIRDQRHFLLLAALAATLAGVALTEDWGQNRRAIGAAIFFPLAAAIAVDAAADWWRRHVRRLGALAPAAAIVLLAGAALHNVHYYFWDYANKEYVGWIFCHELVDVADYVGALEPTPHVYFYSPRWSYRYETLTFSLPGVSGEDRSREFGRFGIDRQTNRPVVYVLMPPYDALATDIVAKNPGGIYRELKRQDGRLVFGAYYIGGT